MRDIAGALLQWAAAGERFALASIVAVRGSAPRGVGAAVGVRADGAVVGSLSGGCVEGSVHALALQTLKTGQPLRTSFDHDPDDPFAVGLTCGGVLDVHIQPVDPQHDRTLLEALRAGVDGTAVAVVRKLSTGATLLVRPDGRTGSLGDAPPSRGDDSPAPGTASESGSPAALDERVVVEARAMLEQDRSGLRRVCLPLDPEDEHEVFVECWTTPPRMLVFGAIDHAAALARVGRFLGYRVTVCDARAVFATAERFPEADEVVVRWPHEYLAEVGADARTVICVLTHDAKFDVPVLREALRGPARYVGALGSRRTHADRVERLRAAGVGDAELRRLRAPIGLDLGGRTPEETAISIAAEIVATRNGTDTRADTRLPSTLPLSRTDGPIHVDA